MEKQKKCPACGYWNTGDIISCEKCHSSLDKNEILKQDREKIFGKPKVEKPSWLENYLERTKDSTNPFVRFAHVSLKIGWITYMAILTFIIWFAVGFSG